MKTNSPLELSVLDHRPASSADRVHCLFPFPGKCQAFSVVVWLKTIIQIPMHGSQLKLSQMILSEGDISWHNEVDEVLYNVPRKLDR